MKIGIAAGVCPSIVVTYTKYLLRKGRQKDRSNFNVPVFITSKVKSEKRKMKSENKKWKREREKCYGKWKVLY